MNTTMLRTVADIMHPEGKILLRPEFGLLGPRWPVIACEKLATLKQIQALYKRGRDIVISTGIKDEITPPQYQSMLLAAAIIEPRQSIATRDIIEPGVYQAHVERWGKERWPNASPILCLYHLPLIDAHDIIPAAYSALSYTSGSGRPRGGALLVEGDERSAVMALPVEPVPLTLRPCVIEYQDLLRRSGLATFACP
jgi:hypothetical protein